MAEENSPASEAANAGPSASFPLFIDTNLDTHLAMVVSAEDTVADLKRKVMVEHPICFPNVGQITIHALKVRRKSCFYHLPDAMVVRSAFEGTKRTWFVHVDAASTSLTEAEGVPRASFLRSENAELKKSHISPLEPGATDLLDDPAVRSQSHVVNVPADENLFQPGLRSALVNDGQKPPSFDHPLMMPSFNDDSQLPEVASNHAENPQILSNCQQNDVSKGLNLLAKDSGSELGANLANDENDVLATCSPSKYDKMIGQRKNVGDEVCEVDIDEDGPASFVAINKDYSKKRDGNLLLHSNLEESLQFAAKMKYCNEKDQNAIVGPENPSKEDHVRTGADYTEMSKLENKLKESSSEDERRTKNATSLVLTSKPLDDDCPSANQLVNDKREKKRQASSSHYEVESEALSKINEGNKGQSGDRSKPEAKSSNASGSTYGSPDEVFKKNVKGSAKESNPTIAAEETTQDVTVRNPSNLSERDTHSGSPEPMLESTVTETAICFAMGVGAYVDNHGKVEGKVDDLEQATAPVSKKVKRLKKHHMVSEKATAETLDKEGDHIPVVVTISQNEGANLSVNVIQSDKPNLSSLTMTHVTCESLEDISTNARNDGIKENEINGIVEEAKGVILVEAVASENKKAKKRKKHLVDEPENLASLTAPHATCKSEENICAIAGFHLSEETGKEDSTLPKRKEAKVVLSEAQNSRDLVGTSKVPGPDEATQTVDFEDRKGKKPTKSRAGGTKTHALQSGRGYFKNTGEVNHQRGSENRWDDNDDGASVNSKHQVVESMEVETASSQTKKIQVPKAGQAVNASGDEVCPKSAPISRIEDAADCSKGKRKRKSKKNLLEQQDGEHVALDLDVCRNDENKKDNASPRKKNKQKSDKTSSKNQLTESLLEGGGFRVKTEASKPKKSFNTAALEQIPSDTLEFEVNTRPSRTDARETDYHVNDSQHKDSDRGIDFLEHFVPKGDELVVTAPKLVDKETQVRKPHERTTEQAKEPNLQSEDTTLHLNSPTNSQNHQKHKKKPQDSTLDGSAHTGPLLKAEKNMNVNHHGKTAAAIADTSSVHQQNNSVAVLDGKKEPLKSKREDGFGNSVSLPSSEASPKVSATASRKKANASQVTSRACTESSEEPIYIRKQGKQKSRLNQYRVAVRKVPDKQFGKVLSNFDRERNMFAASDSIFKNISGESSEDEANDSDATMGSFSYHSFASAYSDRDYKGTPSDTSALGRKANMVSPGAEHVSSFANSEKNTEKGGDGITLSRPVDMLLRASRSYKKAKRNASRSVLEDTESQQPVEMFPDSQAAPDFPQCAHPSRLS